MNKNKAKIKKRIVMKSDDRKNLLLECAQKLFFTKGFDETTVTEIMECGGVSKGGFYHHFTSKEEILQVLREA